MKVRAKVANWVSKSRWRLYCIFLLLMVVPITFFAYSVSRVLKQQTERQAVTESSQIARLSATLIEEHFRQSTSYLEAFAVHTLFRQAWMEGDLKEVGHHLAQAHALRPDFVFFSVYDLDDNMRAISAPEPTLLNQNFAYRDWYKGVPLRPLLERHWVHISRIGVFS